MINLDMSKYSVITLDEVHSTNSWALENILCLDDKTIIFTTNQTSGRGRYNRKWICDNSENIYTSIVLKPENTDNYPYQNLTQYLSVILCKFLETEFNLNPQIKWPNDILVNGAKISGILAETHMNNNKVEGIVLGLGLNVNMKDDTLSSIDQKATSLYSILNKNFDCEIILRKLSDEFFEDYDKFIKEGFKFIKADYIKRCGFLGKNITVKEQGKSIGYFAKSIDDNGLLLAIDENNNECKIITGDILC